MIFIMIVCVCNSVAEHRIRAAIDAGADSFDALQFELGVALGCGQCETTVREMLDAHIKENHCTTAPLFPATAPLSS